MRSAMSCCASLLSACSHVACAWRARAHTHTPTHTPTQGAGCPKELPGGVPAHPTTAFQKPHFDGTRAASMLSLLPQPTIWPLSEDKPEALRRL